MDIGLMMDSDYHEGQTQRQAFDAVLTTATQAETLGFDSLWLAERHFSPPGSAALVPSIGAAPLLLATAIAMRTSRIRIGYSSPLAAPGASGAPRVAAWHGSAAAGYREAAMGRTSQAVR